MLTVQHPRATTLAAVLPCPRAELPVFPRDLTVTVETLIANYGRGTIALKRSEALSELSRNPRHVDEPRLP